MKCSLAASWKDTVYNSVMMGSPIFKSEKRKIPYNLNNVKIENVLIKNVPPSAKYLGVILDENLH